MIIKGIKAQTAASVTNALLSFVVMMALARMLGTGSSANYSVLLNAGVLALMVLEGGYAVLAYRETSAATQQFLPWHDQLLPLFTGYALCMALLLGLLPISGLLGQSSVAWLAVMACILLVGHRQHRRAVQLQQGRAVLRNEC